MSKAKLTPQLIDEHDIRFQALPCRSWPPQYAQVFQKIYDTNQRRFEDKQADKAPNFNFRLLDEAQLKSRSRELVNQAYCCRSERANEATWRLQTEHIVLSRFNDQIACPTCRTRTWISEVQAPAELHHRPKDLQRRREKRTYCKCTPEEIAGSPYETPNLLFSNKAQETVHHVLDEGLAKKGVPNQQPDRVYGLRHTDRLKSLLMSEKGQGLRHSPFDGGLVSYPFLILEAKAEKGAAGFSAVEDQTAFPIRTLLKIQQELRTVSGSNHVNDPGPLVWFLANRGDEWRVYGCCVVGNAYRIIDLWHGSVLFEDRALQLLLIIDYIFDWARDIYRPKIIRSLQNFTGVEGAFDEDGTRTLPDSNIWSQWEDDTMTRSSTPRQEHYDSAFTEDSNPSRVNCDADLEMEDASLPGASGLNAPMRSNSRPISMSHPLLRFTLSDAKPTPWHWPAIGTIRHASIVKFSFVRLHVPDDNIETFISSTSLLGCHHHNSIMSSVLDYIYEKLLIVDESTISWLEKTWTGGSSSANQSSPSQRLLARISYVTYFATDWQIIREILCVTLSPTSFKHLQRTSSNKMARSPRIHESQRIRQDQLEPTIRRIRRWADPESVMASVLGVRWEVDLDSCLFKAPELLPVSWKDRDFLLFPPWAGNRDSIEYLFSFLMIGSQDRQDIKHPPCITRSSVLEQLPLDVSNNAPLFDIPHLPTSVDRTGVILLKSANLAVTNHSTKTPVRYCLVILEEYDFVDVNYFAQKIANAMAAGQLYLSRVGNIWDPHQLPLIPPHIFDHDKTMLGLLVSEMMQTPTWSRDKDIMSLFPGAKLY